MKHNFKPMSIIINAEALLGYVLMEHNVKLLSIYLNPVATMCCKTLSYDTENKYCCC